jgi:hypothetical protein
VSAQSASGRNWHTQLIFERSLHKIISPWSQKISDLRRVFKGTIRYQMRQVR